MLQTVKMTHKEKVEMYRKVDKDLLIEMLIQCNTLLSAIKPKVETSDITDKEWKNIAKLLYPKKKKEIIMNNNIKENYVSFEIAKLLKEKGFDVHCNSYYYGAYRNSVENVGNYNSTDQDVDEPHYSQPTTALAIKWIRENFGIHIWIQALNIVHSKWYFAITKKGDGHNLYDGCLKHDYYNSPEETENAAILYTLNNLI